MNRKAIVLILLTAAVLVGAPESFARPQYLTDLNTVFGDGSCGTCHVSASGGGPRNPYGTLFENVSNHAIDPSAALTAIGPPPTATTTPLIMPTATGTPTTTETPTETTEVPTMTATVTPATLGFGIVLSLVGLFVCALLVRRLNK